MELTHDSPSLARRVAQLEETVAYLQKQIAALVEEQQTVVAPFRVVTESGQLVLEVRAEQNENSLRVFNRHGVAAASLGTDVEGGWLALRNNAGALVGYFHVESYGAQLALQNNDGNGGVFLFGGDSGGGINIAGVAKQGEIESVIGLWADEQGGKFSIYCAGTNDKPSREMVTLAGNWFGGTLILADADGYIGTELCGAEPDLPELFGKRHNDVL